MDGKNLFRAAVCVTLLGASVALFSGCKKKESTIAGTLIGAGLGAGVGAAVGGGGGAAIGAVVGGVGGAGVGYAVGDDDEEK